MKDASTSSRERSKSESREEKDPHKRKLEDDSDKEERSSKKHHIDKKDKKEKKKSRAAEGNSSKHEEDSLRYSRKPSGSPSSGSKTSYRHDQGDRANYPPDHERWSGGSGSGQGREGRFSGDHKRDRFDYQRAGYHREREYRADKR